MRARPNEDIVSGWLFGDESLRRWRESPGIRRNHLSQVCVDLPVTATPPRSDVSIREKGLERIPVHLARCVRLYGPAALWCFCASKHIVLEPKLPLTNKLHKKSQDKTQILIFIPRWPICTHKPHSFVNSLCCEKQFINVKFSKFLPKPHRHYKMHLTLKHF